MLMRFGNDWPRSKRKHFRLLINLMINLIQIGKLDFLVSYVASAFLKPCVIFWCIFINYYIYLIELYL